MSTGRTITTKRKKPYAVMRYHNESWCTAAGYFPDSSRYASTEAAQKHADRANWNNPNKPAYVVDIRTIDTSPKALGVKTEKLRLQVEVDDIFHDAYRTTRIRALRVDRIDGERAYCTVIRRQDKGGVITAPQSKTSMTLDTLTSRCLPAWTNTPTWMRDLA